MKMLARLLYWKLCFPKHVELLPIRLRVISGPFAGMPYTHVACGSAHSAKLLGTYEKELHPIIQEILAHRFQVIVDIGAAEGYYAVGFSRVMQETSGHVIAFEAHEYGRKLLQLMVRNNAVNNIDIRKSCDVVNLSEVLDRPGEKFILCDVEGYEAELLDPSRIPALRHCSILVELHDTPSVPVSKIVRDRFQDSHLIEEIVSTQRSWKDFPVKNVCARALPRAIALRAMNEGRPLQSWFWMRPLNGFDG